MNPEEYKSSKCQEQLAIFLGTTSGKELIALLRHRAKPSMASKKAYGTHEDVKMQMSINLVDTLAQNDVIDLMESLSLPPSKKNQVSVEFEPLEDDSQLEDTVKKKITTKR